MGGSRRADTDQPANLLTLCGSGVTGCHGWTEREREKARAAGFLLRQTQTPTEVPVQTMHGSRLYDNYGGYTRPGQLIPDYVSEVPF